MPMTPASWLTGNGDLLPRSGDGLDVACGTGRNTLWLAAHGLAMLGIDRDGAALRALEDEARRRELPVRVRVVDLERGEASLEQHAFDMIAVFHYLHRALFPALLAALRPGGVLVYETFTSDQARRGKPTNPDFLLHPGELRELVRPLEIVREREGDYEGRMVASVIARRGPPRAPR